MVEKAQKKTCDDKIKQQSSQKPAAKKLPQQSPLAVMQKAKLFPGSLSSKDTLLLQRSIGNQGVVQLLEDKKNQPPKQAASAEISRQDSTLYQAVKDAARKFNAKYVDNPKPRADDGGMELYELGKILDPIDKWINWATGLGDVEKSALSARLKELENLSSFLVKRGQNAAQNLALRALKTQQDDKKQLLEYLKEYQETWSKSVDPRIRNTCKFIESGRVLFYVATPTGDWWLRVRENKKDPEKYRAYFISKELDLKGKGDDIKAGDITRYNFSNLTDNTNVIIGPNIWKGWSEMCDGIDAVTVVNPSSENNNKQLIFETIEHEFLHIANRPLDRYNLAGLRRAAEKKNLGVVEAEKAFLNYKEEYRIIYQQDSSYLSKFDNKVPNKSFQGQNFSARQLEIFKRIKDEYTNISEAWEANPLLADGAPFRKAVAGFREPARVFNKPGYFGVYCFLKDLDAVGEKQSRTEIEQEMGIDAAPVKAPIEDSSNPQVQALLQTTNSLEPEEAAYIIGESKEKTIWANKLEKHLAGPALEKIYNALRDQAAKGSK